MGEKVGMQAKKQSAAENMIAELAENMIYGRKQPQDSEIHALAGAATKTKSCNNGCQWEGAWMIDTYKS